MANAEIKLHTIDIKGKEYVTVNERLKFFRKAYPDYRLISEIINSGSDCVTMVAKILDPAGSVVATGHAFEEKQSSYINKTSYVENCETSAWGRALANFGIGIDANVCSADELINALLNQGNPPAKAKKTKIMPERSGELSDEMITDLISVAKSVGKTPEAMAEYYGIQDLGQLSKAQYGELMAMLRAKADKIKYSKLEAELEDLLDGEGEI